EHRPRHRRAHLPRDLGLSLPAGRERLPLPLLRRRGAAVIREHYMNVLRRIDFTEPLTEAQLDVVSRATEEEYAELARWHGLHAARATATAEAITYMWSMLSPWCKTSLGEWRTF